MDITIKDILGGLSVAIAAVGFFQYLLDIFRKKTKPHAFSWLVWTAIGVVGFGIQLQNDAGPGSWLLGVTVLGTFVIFILSLIYGHRDFPLSDKISLAVATLAFVLWLGVDQPVVAAIIITLTEAIGAFFPTYRKSYMQPYEETVFSYFAYATSIGLSILALENYAPENVIYPAGVFLLNCGLVAFLLVRRSQLKR